MFRKNMTTIGIISGAISIILFSTLAIVNIRDNRPKQALVFTPFIIAGINCVIISIKRHKRAQQ